MNDTTTATKLLDMAQDPALSPQARNAMIQEARRLMAAPEKANLNIFVIDESGSMSGLATATIKAVNTAFTRLRDVPNASVVAMTFDSSANRRAVRMVISRCSPENAVLSHRNYNPAEGGGTPLYDAIKSAVEYGSAFKAANPDAIITVMIQTDGFENSSQQWNLGTVREQITMREREGWQFIFMGANLDAAGHAMARDMGFRPASTMSYNGANTAQAFNATAELLVGRGMSGQAVQYSATHRAAAGDVWSKIDATATAKLTPTVTEKKADAEKPGSAA